MPGDERAESAGEDLSDNDHQRDDKNRSDIFCEQAGIDEQPDGNKEDCAEHVADRLQQHFNALYLTSLSHDRANKEGAESDAVLQLDGQKRDAEAETEHGD